MALLHRALFTWFLLLVFLILIVLRLDKRIQWNWFIVFIPLWFYEFILLICSFFNLMSHCKNVVGLDRFSNLAQRKLMCFFIILLLMVSQTILCLKLEYAEMNISLFDVMVPVWVIMPVILVDLFLSLLKRSRSSYC